MFNRNIIQQLVQLIATQDGIGDKAALTKLVQQQFQLTRDRSVYAHRWFAIRFSYSKTKNFSNVVLSLSALQKYDAIPFLVCLVTPSANYLYLANSTLLRKISHSSQALRCDNIRGSFLGSDIIRNLDGVENLPENFEDLYASHENYTFSENLERLVEATNNIIPKGKPFVPTQSERVCIQDSIRRTEAFMASNAYSVLDTDLAQRVQSVASEIAIAAFVDNVNLRGRIIEYLITGEGNLRETLISCLRTGQPLPNIYTADDLGDYYREFDRFDTATDIKTKILFLSSNPKGYNIDKFLRFLGQERNVYLVYIITIDSDGRLRTKLCSPFHTQLLLGTRVMTHWAGRNSRGVTQYDGKALEAIVQNFDSTIDRIAAEAFLQSCILRGIP